MTTQSSQTNIKQDVFSIVTNRIIEQLEKGKVPWRQPWSEAGPPKNMITGRAYRGLNVLLLSSLGYPHNLFLTLKQINELGGVVKRGEHACPVVFWSQKETTKEGTEEKETKRILRYYSVFNIDQCISIPEERIPELFLNENVAIESCEAVVENMPQKPKIQHKGQEAHYVPKTDIINMPKLKSFVDSEAYYTALFHELIHSTGHGSRLNRESITNNEKYGSEAYSEEELIAQIGACFLSSQTGCSLKHFPNDVAYIQGWLSRLKGDKRLVLFASSKAQRATDFILNNQLSVLQEDIGNEDGES
jgi:antirestriction protein ArdC